MVNVTKNNFIEQSNDLIRQLPSASFIAIDEEMTGISIPGTTRPKRDESPWQQYTTRLKHVPERYSIIQLGISLFHHNKHEPPKKKSPPAAAFSSGRGYTISPPSTTASTALADSKDWTVRRYNFYMFPSAENNAVREVVLNPSAIAFLQKHNLSIDTWCSQGIPYLFSNDPHVNTAKAAMKSIRDYSTAAIEGRAKHLDHTDVNPTIQDSLRRRVELRRDEDKRFFARAMAGLREWLDSPTLPNSDFDNNNDTLNDTIMNNNEHHEDDEEGADNADSNLRHASYLMPSCNAFLRRALYEAIAMDYPALEAENAGNNQIRVWRLTPEERRYRHHSKFNQQWKDFITQQIGMWRVYAALTLTARGYRIPVDCALFAPNYDSVDWKHTMDIQEDMFHILESAVVDQTDLVATIPPVPHKQPTPVIVHNGFMDLLFLLTHFYSFQLPESVIDCKRWITGHFPVLYDTKILATECWNPMLGDIFHTNPITDTSLSSLYQYVVVREHVLTRPVGSNGNTPAPRHCLLDQFNVIKAGNTGMGGRRRSLPPALMIADNEDQEHEAAYDAYMTGAVFIGLCQFIYYHTIKKQQPISTPTTSNDNIHPYGSNFYEFMDLVSGHTFEHSNKYNKKVTDQMTRYYLGRNLIYQMSLYTLDLELASVDDPLSRGMLKESTFRINEIDPSINTRDIVRSLSGLHDSQGRRVNFEIMWVDDTTFLVAASSRDVEIPNLNPNNGDSNNNTNHPKDPNEEMTALLQEHGLVLRRSLTNRFGRDNITTLKDHLHALERRYNKVEEIVPENWVGRLLSVFGFERKRLSANADSRNYEPPRKRRRV